MANYLVQQPGPFCTGPAPTSPIVTWSVYNASTPTVTDGNQIALQCDSHGNLNVNLAAGSISGGNAAASPTGAVVPASADYIGFNVGGNLVGVSAANPLPIAGTISATNPSVSTTGTGVPASATYIGIANGSGNLVGVSAANPIRIDPTGTTVQPVSAAQATAANLNATVVGTGTFAVQAAQSGNWTSRVVGNGGAVVDFVASGATAPANALLVGGVYNSTPLTLSNGQACALQFTSAGALITSGGGGGGTVAQGTAAATTAGWPFINGTVAAATQTWNSGGQTTATIATIGYATVEISLQKTGTVSGGTAAFEVSDDGGTSWFAAQACNSTGGSVGVNTATLSALSFVSYQASVAGYTNFRVRQSGAFSGTGSIAVLVQGSAAVSSVSILNTASVNLSLVSGAAIVTSQVSGTFATGGAVASNTALTSATYPLLIAGSDYGGTAKIQNWKVDSSGIGFVQFASAQAVTLTSTTITGNVSVTQSTSPWIVAGGGTAGSPGTAVLTVQGISGGTTIPVTATIAATQTIAVTQATASSLNATVVGTGTFVVQDSADMAGTTPGTAPSKTLIVGAIYNSSAPSPTTGQTLPLQLDASGNLNVNIKAGAGSGGTAIADEAAVTEGTTSFTPIGGYYKTSPAALTTGQGGIVSLTAARAMFTELHSVGGTALVLGQAVAASCIPVVLPSATNVPVSQATAASLNATVVGNGTFAVQAAQAGTWSDRVVGNTGNPFDGVSGFTAPTATVQVGGYYSSSGDLQAFSVDASGNLNVNIKSGAGSGGTAITDEGSFTEGTTSFTPIGGYYKTSPAALTTGQGGTVSLTAARAMFTDLHSVGGTALVLGQAVAASCIPVVLPSATNVPVAQATAASLNATVVGTGTFAVQAAQSGNWTSRVVGNGGATLDFAQGGATAPTNALAVGGVYNTSLPTLTNGQAGAIQLDVAGQQFVDVNYWAGVALGAMANYGTSPGAVKVPGVNAFITNSPAVTITSGTVTTVSTVTAVTSITNAVKVTGNAGGAFDSATGAAPPANAVQVGMLAATALPAATTATNIAVPMTDKFGRQACVLNTVRDLVGTATLNSSSNSATSFIAAGGSGVFNDIISLIITNESSTATIVSLSDNGSGGTVYKFALAANGGIVINFPTPLPQGTSNAAWNVLNSASVACDYVAVFAKNK